MRGWISRCLVIVLFACLAAPVVAQKPEPEAVDQQAIDAFDTWLEAYAHGRIPIAKNYEIDQSAVTKFEKVFKDVAAIGDLAAAKLLWRATVMEFDPSIDKHVRLAAQPGRVRNFATSLIAGIKDPGVDPWLLQMALRRGGKYDRERAQALRVMAERKTEGLDQVLLENLNKFPVAERITAVMALEKVGGETAIPVLVKLLRQREPNLRIAAIQSLCTVLSKFSDETVKENLGAGTVNAKWTKDVIDRLLAEVRREQIWQARMAVCEGLVRLKNRLSVPALIQVFSWEKKRKKHSNPVLEAACHDGLEMLTGKDLPEGAPQLWADFWAKEGPKFRYSNHPRGASAREKAKKNPASNYVKYFDMEIRSRRLIFIVDFSGSMSERVRLTGGRYANSQEGIKYTLVQKELAKVVRSLPSTSICNVIFFNHEVSVWRPGKKGRPKLVPMNDANKESLLEYIWSTAPSGSTNIYGALKTALGMADRGIYDKYYRTAYDTIYFLSDGGPTAGETTDTEEILREVQRINKLRRVRIHTIVFGEDTNNITFLERLAKENGGRFLHVK